MAQTLSAPRSTESYSRLPPQHETHPFRLPIILIVRLFLIHATTPSPTNSQSSVSYLEELFRGFRGQNPWWPPKYMSLPGHLSPGEYKDIGTALAVLSAMITDIGEPQGSTEEERQKSRAVNKRFTNLAILTRARYNTISE